jgi:stage V sporulation protein B
VRRDPFLRGAFILAAGSVVSRALGGIYRFALPVLWGGGERAIYGMGLFGLAIPIYVVALTLSSLGLPLAVSKLVAACVASGDLAGTLRLFAVARTALLVLGLALTAAMMAAAPVFGRYYNPDAVPSILAVAPAVLLVSLMSAYRGLFQGLQVMTPYAVSQVVEQLVRVITMLGLGVLLLPLGIHLAAAGASFGAVSGAGVGLDYLLVVYRQAIGQLRPQGAGDREGLPARAVLGELVRLAIPFSLAGLAFPLISFVDALLVPPLLQRAGMDQQDATTAFGSLAQIATPFVNLPTAVTNGIFLSLMPAVAEADALQRRDRVARLAGVALRVTLLLTVPMALGLIALARELPEALFRYPEAAVPIRILAPAAVFLGLQQMSSAVLQGIGLTQLPVRNLFLGVGVKMVLTWLLTVPFGIAGAGVASVVGFGLAALLNLLHVARCVGGIEGAAGAVLRPCLAAAAMFACARLTVTGLAPAVGLLPATLLAVVVGAAVYGLTVLLVGGVREEDFEMIPRYGPRLAALLRRLGLLAR